MKERIKHLDKKNAMSILNASEREMSYTLKLEVNEDSAFNIIRNIYECFRMLGDSRLVSKGIASQDHIQQIRELEVTQIKTDRPLKLIDTLRKIRHNINYYGYIPSVDEAKDAISIAKSCFYPLIEVIRKELR